MSDGLTQAGFVAIVGKPNVGKSTLLNALLGVKIAPVSPKPQTTRRGVRGIATRGNMQEGGQQAVFVDTPGLHKPKDALGQYMNSEVHNALSDVDAVVWVVDLRHPPTEEDKLVARTIKDFMEHHSEKPVWLVGNKLDAAKHPGEALELYQALVPDAPLLRVRKLSAQENPQAVAGLLDEVLGAMPDNPFFFPDNQKADQSREQWAGEIVREEAMRTLREELPYSVAVKVIGWEDREPEAGQRNKDAMQVISCELYVERSAHRRIVIGEGGRMLKQIGQRARKQLEVFTARRVYLDIQVVVQSDWRKDPEALRELGYE